MSVCLWPQIIDDLSDFLHNLGDSGEGLNWSHGGLQEYVGEGRAKCIHEYKSLLPVASSQEQSVNFEKTTWSYYKEFLPP